MSIVWDNLTEVQDDDDIPGCSDSDPHSGAREGPDTHAATADVRKRSDMLEMLVCVTKNASLQGHPRPRPARPISLNAVYQAVRNANYMKNMVMFQ